MSEIKYVFSINPGRCGSDYVSTLLDRSWNARSLHEADPIMTGRPMQEWNDGREQALRALMPMKLEQIRKHRRFGRVYSETSHTFILGWGYLLLEHLKQEEIGILVLRRDREKIARSLLRVHEVPGTTEYARTWYLSPYLRGNLSAPPPDASPMELCRWYVDEVYERAEEFQERFPGIRYVDCDLEDLSEMATVEAMFEAFGLVPAPDLADVVGVPVNQRSEWPAVDPRQPYGAHEHYPRADELPAELRDRLVADIVEHLHQHEAAAIRAFRPDYRMGGTYLTDVIGFFLPRIPALEKDFGVSIQISDTERICMAELLRSIHPRDPTFSLWTRHGPPGLYYTFDHNVVNGPVLLARRLGLWGAVSNVAKLVVRGEWSAHHARGPRRNPLLRLRAALWGLGWRQALTGS